MYIVLFYVLCFFTKNLSGGQKSNLKVWLTLTRPSCLFYKKEIPFYYDILGPKNAQVRRVFFFAEPKRSVEVIFSLQQRIALASVIILTMNSSSYAPPMFSYSSDAFDNDFDIGLLSEYLLDEENLSLENPPGRKQSFSRSDFSTFPHEEGMYS